MLSLCLTFIIHYGKLEGSVSLMNLGLKKWESFLVLIGIAILLIGWNVWSREITVQQKPGAGKNSYPVRLKSVFQPMDRHIVSSKDTF